MAAERAGSMSVISRASEVVAWRRRERPGSEGWGAAVVSRGSEREGLPRQGELPPCSLPQASSLGFLPRTGPCLRQRT